MIKIIAYIISKSLYHIGDFISFFLRFDFFVNYEIIYNAYSECMCLSADISDYFKLGIWYTVEDVYNDIKEHE